MQCFQGKSVYKGIVIGPVAVLKKNDYQVKCIKVRDANEELQRIQKAVERSKEQLQKMYDQAVAEAGEASAAIFEVHSMMLNDDDYLGAIQSMIRTEEVNAEHAVSTVSSRFSQKFAAMDDYMKARATDVIDISERLIRNLSGQEEMIWDISEPSIVIAEDLSPSETIKLDKSKILAFVTVHGSIHSHTAILARMMNIPALVGVPLEINQLENGISAIADGYEGKIILMPDHETCEKAEKKMQEEWEKLRLLHELKGKANITLDGHEINIYANIGSVDDMDSVLENDAAGIGLFRSEFLYLGKSDFPTEDEQYEAYKEAAQRMGDKKVVIRTLDIGVDKQVEYFNLEKEENPALGYRAIRFCLKEQDVFQIQLRALLRAAVYGKISILYPMITSVDEVCQIYELVDKVAAELKEEGVPYKIPKQGIMIETPAAVMISDELAEMVDFFSIGTNDLTQYTLAIDRQNEKLDDFYNPYHKAILRMIQLVVDNAHRCGKQVGICGELAADTLFTEQLIRMGVDELSVAPSMILKLRKIIREMNVESINVETDEIIFAE